MATFGARKLTDAHDMHTDSRKQRGCCYKPHPGLPVGYGIMNNRPLAGWLADLTWEVQNI